MMVSKWNLLFSRGWFAGSMLNFSGGKCKPTTQPVDVLNGKYIFAVVPLGNVSQQKSSNLHPGRLTWNLQITHLEKKLIFQTSMIMFQPLIFQGVKETSPMSVLQSGRLCRHQRRMVGVGSCPRHQPLPPRQIQVISGKGCGVGGDAGLLVALVGIRNVQPTCFFQRWVVVFVSIFSIQGGPLLVINGSIYNSYA